MARGRPGSGPGHLSGRHFVKIKVKTVVNMLLWTMVIAHTIGIIVVLVNGPHPA